MSLTHVNILSETLTAVSLSHDFVFFLRHSYTGKGPFWATQSQEGAEKNVMIAHS